MPDTPPSHPFGSTGNANRIRIRNRCRHAVHGAHDPDRAVRGGMETRDVHRSVSVGAGFPHRLGSPRAPRPRHRHLVPRGRRGERPGSSRRCPGARRRAVPARPSRPGVRSWPIQLCPAARVVGAVGICRRVAFVPAHEPRRRRRARRIGHRASTRRSQLPDHRARALDALRPRPVRGVDRPISSGGGRALGRCRYGARRRGRELLPGCTDRRRDRHGRSRVAVRDATSRVPDRPCS